MKSIDLIEVYTEDSAPPLYDYFLDRQGVFTAMDDIEDFGEIDGVVQIVCAGGAVNQVQEIAVLQMANQFRAKLVYILDIPSFL